MCEHSLFLDGFNANRRLQDFCIFAPPEANTEIGVSEVNNTILCIRSVLNVLCYLGI